KVERPEELFELLVAHELTHALQDQQLDLLARLSALADQDRLHTFNARIEGHAVFVHERIGEELGYTDAIAAFRQLVSPSAELGTATAATAFQLRWSRMLRPMDYPGGRQGI